MQNNSNQREIQPQLAHQILSLISSSQNQQDKDAIAIFDSLMHYGTSLDTLDHILIHQQAKQITDILNIAKKHCIVKFCCQFGSAIVFRKEEDWDKVVIDMVFPVAWDLGSNIHAQSSSKMYPCSPKGVKHFTIGKLSLLDHNKQKIVKDFFIIFNDYLSKALNKQKQNKKKNHHTPSWLFQLLLKVFEKLQQNYINNTSYQQQEQNQNNQKDIIVSSKGGTLDVGMHTGITKPNTSAPVAFALMKYFLQNQNDGERQFCQVFEASYLLYITTRANIHRRVSDYIYKIRQLMYKIRVMNKNGIQYNKQKLNHMIKQATKQKPARSYRTFTKTELTQDKQKLFNQIQYLQWELTGIGNEQQNAADNLGGSLQSKKAKLGTSYKFSDLINSETQKPIKCLYELYSKIQRPHWVLLVQSTFFRIMKQFSQTKKMPIIIEDISRQFITVLNQYDQKMKQKITKLSTNYKCYMASKNQAISLVYLIKLIGCIIVFQTVKWDRKDMESNLQEYRIPFNDEDMLLKNFSSLSFQARQAAQLIFAYFKQRKQKHAIFVLEPSSDSFIKFALKTYNETEQMQNWLQKQKQKFQRQKLSIQKQLKAFHQKLNTAVSQFQLLKLAGCTDRQQRVYRWGSYTYQTIKCNLCFERQMKKKTLEFLQKQDQNFIKPNIPQSPTYQQLYAFLARIPDQIKIMIQIFNIVYGIKQNSSNSFFYRNQNALSSYLSGDILPYASSVKAKRFTKRLYTQNQVRKLIIYPADQAYICYKLSTTPGEFSLKDFRVESQNQTIKLAASDPILFELSNQLKQNSKKRQHQVYSKLEESVVYKLKVEDFVTFCSIRVGPRTQISMLCDALLSRKVSLDVFRQESFELGWEILVRAASSLVAYKFVQNQNQLMFNKTHQIVMDSIWSLIENYHRGWSYSETNSLMIIGPLMSMLSKQLNYNGEGGSLRLLKCAHNQFMKLNNDLKQDPKKTIEIRSRQAFISFCALCCLTQSLLNEKTEQQIEIFTFFIILGHSCTVLMTQNKADHQNYMIMKAFTFLNDRTKFMNMDAVLDYFIKYPNKLSRIIREIDESCAQQTQWEYVPDIGPFVFQGILQVNQKTSQYVVNLQTGILLKDGKKLTGLSKKIKQNKYFKEIFGERDFQVYHRQKLCRTKNGFKELLVHQGNQSDNVFFQFKEIDNTRIQIHMIERKLKDQTVLQEDFKLIQRQTLEKLQFLIPPLYLEGCLAWYSHKSSCITFRNPKIENMKSMDMVILLYEDTFTVKKAIILSNQSKQKSLQQVLQNINVFDLLIFKSKNYEYEQHLVYRILRQIEREKYIIKLKCGDIIKFWLHRYDLVFKLENQELIPQGHDSYAVHQSYHSIQECPWDKSTQIRAIVIKKFEESALSAMHHDYKIIIPNLNPNKSKDLSVYIPEGFNTKLTLFFYDVHQHFKDIRGRTSEANLLLVQLIASLQSPTANSFTGLTNNEYCQSLMRSCYNTRPFTLSQYHKIENILFHACQNRKSSLLLCCQVMLECSKSLNSLYYTQQVQVKNKAPIISKQKRQLQKYPHFLLNRYKQYFALARLHYFSHNNELRPFQKLNDFQLSVLRMKSNKLQNKRITNKWSQKFPLKISINQSQLTEKESNMTEKFKKLKDFYSKIQNKNKEEPNNNLNLNQKQQVFEQKINQVQQIFNKQQQKQKLENSLMLKQMIEQQKQSYQNYLKVLQVNSKMQQTKNKLAQFQQCRESIQTELFVFKKQIQDQVELLHKTIANHVDVMTEQVPALSPVHFSKAVFEGQSYLRNFYPDSSSEQLAKLLKILQMWMNTVVELDSLKRLKYLLITGQDLRGIRRQILSPRQQITKFRPWVCFEAEMRIKIWASQFQTYEDLTKSPNQSYSQLNMGEGKTQVIIPIFVLQKLYCKKQEQRCIPRINLLSSLIDQSRLNYFRFFSATSFRVPCIDIPFNRGVNLCEQNLRAIKNGLQYFLQKCVVICDRESCLSMTLKIRQLNQIAFNQQSEVSPFLSEQKQKWLFGNHKVFDILDQVDALVTPKKSFVYAIGGSEKLPQANIRIQLCRYFLQIFVKEMLQFCLKQEMIACDSYDQLRFAKEEGTFPRIRYTSLKQPQKSNKFKSKIVDLFLSKQYLPDNFSFYKSLNEDQEIVLRKYFIHQSQSEHLLQQIDIPHLVLPQIYAVRGIIAFGILEHCLSLRCGVEYGVPDKDHPKRLGVPYEAADVPSKRSQYAHPDVAAILSYISRYISGLTSSQFNESIERLMRLTESSQKANYKKWLHQLSIQKRKALNLQDITKINFKSMGEVDRMFECFKKNRATIAFWLGYIVFPIQLRQYTRSITSSSWDIANAKYSIGFSGTKDSKPLFPAQLNWTPSHNPQIRGTDGKNIALLLSQTKSVIQITDEVQDSTLKWTWQKFIAAALKQGISCVIDSGAILVGKSIQNEIAPWLGERLIKSKSNLKGITYPNQRGEWKVYDFNSKTYIQRNTRIPQHQTFVIFDQARTRGSDIKMAYSVCAALSLGPDMTQLKLMQAMGRLRNLQAGQTIKIFATSEIIQKIESFKKQDTVQSQIKCIIRWVLYNSVFQNEKFFSHNNRLGWIHFKSINLGMRPHIQQTTPKLQSMYRKSLSEDTPYNINKLQLQKLTQEQRSIKDNPIAIKQFTLIQKYGKNFKIKCQGFDDVCERQVEFIQEAEQQQQKIATSALPIQQDDNYSPTSSKDVSTLPYKFDDKFLVSKNFRNCTKSKSFFSQSNNIRGSQGYDIYLSKLNKHNQLMYANFIEVTNQGLCAITQREANRMLQQQVKYINPKKQAVSDQQNTRSIIRLADLDIGCKVLKQLNLNEAFVHLRFFNGNQTFSKQKLDGQGQQQLSQYEILRLTLRGIRVDRQIDWQEKLEELSSHFLMRRWIYMDKYHESSLQSIYVSLKNDRI